MPTCHFQFCSEIQRLSRRGESRGYGALLQWGGQNLCLVVPGSNQTQQLFSIQSFTWMALQRSFGPDARPAQRFLFRNYNSVVRYANQKRCGDLSARDPTHRVLSETNQLSGEALRSCRSNASHGGRLKKKTREDDSHPPRYRSRCAIPNEFGCSRIPQNRSYPRNA